MSEFLLGPEKVNVLRSYAVRYGLRSMVETGLYNGWGSGMGMQDDLDSYAVIDRQESNVQAACAAGFDAFCGDSAVELASVLEMFKWPALFWLDAHNVSEQGDTDPDSPLLGELDAILAWPHAAQSVVLVDDVRLMNGRFGWPTVAQVIQKCSRYWNVTIGDDILRAVPREV